MTEKTHENELDALKADIARLREEISGLVAKAANAAGTQAAGNHPGERHEASEGKGEIDGEQDQDMWTDLLRTFETSKAQGEKVIKNLSAEVEQHPLMSIMAAFGLGYIVAKLWHQGDNQ
jgi:polyhydroxyalkanoate synthesis regulator phasin